MGIFFVRNGNLPLVNLGSRKDEKFRLVGIYGEKSEVLGGKARRPFIYEIAIRIEQQ